MLLIILVALILAVLLFGANPVLGALSTIAVIVVGVIVAALWWPEGGLDKIDLMIIGGTVAALAIYLVIAMRPWR